MFAKFMINYSLLSAGVGAAICLLIAPFYGVHWSHWFIGGMLLMVLTFAFAAMLGDEGVAAMLGDVRVATGWRHALVSTLVPFLSIFAIAFLPILGRPLEAWLVPGILFIFAWLIAIFVK